MRYLFCISFSVLFKDNEEINVIHLVNAVHAVNEWMWTCLLCRASYQGSLTHVWVRRSHCSCSTSSTVMFMKLLYRILSLSGYQNNVSISHNWDFTFTVTELQIPECQFRTQYCRTKCPLKLRAPLKITLFSLDWYFYAVLETSCHFISEKVKRRSYLHV